MKSLYPAALGLALAGSVEAAAWPPVNGDLVLGVQATGGTGSTSNVLVNLGPAFQIRDNAEQGAVVNINAELTAAFGSNWFSRTDLWFGVAGNRSAASSGAEVNADGTRVVYASRGASAPGASVLFSGYISSSLGVAGLNIQSMVSGADDLSTRGKGVVTMTQAANPVSWFNSWKTWNPTPGAAFNIFTGGIQNNFGKASNATSFVDIQRVAASGVTKEATVGITRRGDVVVSNSANVFTAAKAIADLEQTQYYVGDTVSINLGVDANTVAITGLPAGLSFNATTGIISGTITALPTTSGVVTVKSGLTTLGTLEGFTMRVSTYPFLGSYDVLITDGPTAGGTPEGKIRVTITKPGTFTASAVLKGTTVAAALKGTFPASPVATTASLDLEFTNSANTVLFDVLLNLTSTSNVVTGTRTNLDASVDTVSGFRLASGPAVSRALTASLAPNVAGNRTTTPGGFGFGTGLLAASGSSSFMGTLGDGQKFTTTFNASLTDQAIVYVQPYNDVVNSFFGGIMDLPNLGQRNSAGAASFGLAQAGRPAAGLKWTRGAGANTSNLAYDSGFGPLNVTGSVSNYTAVAASIKAPGDKLAAQLGAKGNTFVASYSLATTTPADSSAANPDSILDNENEALPDTWLMGANPVTLSDPSITGRFQNEVQVITLAGATPTTALNLTVKLGTGAASAPFAYGATPTLTAAAIQTALGTLANVGVGRATVTADSAQQFRVTFIGTMGYQDVSSLLAVAKSGTTGPATTFSVSELIKGTGNAFTAITVDEVQRVAVGGLSTGDTFTLSFKGVKTANIAYSAAQANTAASILSALQALSNIGVASNIAVAASGSDMTQTFDITFQGGLGKFNQAPLIAASSTTGVPGTFTVTELGVGGSVSGRVIAGTALGTSGAFSATVTLTNTGIKGTLEGVFLQDDSFGTVNGRGQVRIPKTVGLNQDYETIPVTFTTN